MIAPKPESTFSIIDVTIVDVEKGTAFLAKRSSSWVIGSIRLARQGELKSRKEPR